MEFGIRILAHGGENIIPMRRSIHIPMVDRFPVGNDRDPAKGKEPCVEDMNQVFRFAKKLGIALDLLQNGDPSLKLSGMSDCKDRRHNPEKSGVC